MEGRDDQRDSIDRIRKSLHEASLQGNVNALAELLQEDPLLLERTITSFSESPLHIAAMLGHVEFTREILSRKPELASESDSEGFCPLHLASARKNVEVVRVLVRAAPDVCLSTDVHGRTPLHLAAMKGRVEIMEELLKCRPEAVDKVLFDGGETVLHLCVKHSRSKAVEMLLQWLGGRGRGSCEDHQLATVNSKDDHGNTILHLAVARKRIQIIKLLLHNNSDVEVNALNQNGLTALDILTQSTLRDLKDMEIAEVVRSAGGLSATEITGTSTRNNNYSNRRTNNAVHVVRIRGSPIRSRTQSSVGSSWERRFGEYEKWLEKKQNTVMVVASLIASIGFQAVLNPPNRFNQKDSDEQNKLIQVTTRNIATTTAFPPTVSSSNGNDVHFKAYIHANSIAVIGSMMAVLLVMCGLPLRRRSFIWVLMFVMCTSITAMGYSYILATASLVPPSAELDFDYILFTWSALIILILLMHTTRFLVWVVDKAGGSKRVFLWVWCPLALLAFGSLGFLIYRIHSMIV